MLLPAQLALGRLTTPHGVIETPVFMPVGLSPQSKAFRRTFWKTSACKSFSEILTISICGREWSRYGKLGGLHRFMAWPRAILTDSGGFQVFSLNELRKVTEEGVTFRSHLDGSCAFLHVRKAPWRRRSGWARTSSWRSTSARNIPRSGARPAVDGVDAALGGAQQEIFRGAQARSAVEHGHVGSDVVRPAERSSAVGTQRLGKL